MNGFEQTVVWLFAFFCGSATVSGAVKAWAKGRVDVAREHARAQVEINRLVMHTQLAAAREAMGLAHDPMFVPPQWTEDEQ